MNIVAISDTHTHHKHLTSRAVPDNWLPDADVLIHAGDFTSVGREWEVDKFIQWCDKQSSRYTYGVVFIAGNHDRCFDPKYGEYSIDDAEGTEVKQTPAWLRNILSNLKLGSSKLHYLENESIELGGLKFWGSPITPWYHGDHWAFNAHRGPDIEAIWNQIPMDTDVLITHGPAAYKLDWIPSTNEYVGCEDLRKAINRVKPKLSICGHIHESYGAVHDVDTTYVNASICQASYYPRNKPWVLIYDEVNRDIQIKFDD